MNENFWDAHGTEIGACAIFEHFAGSDKFCRHDKKMTESILWVLWGAEFGMGGGGSKQFRRTQIFSIKNVDSQSIESENKFSAPRFFSGSEKNSRNPIFGEICACLNIEVLSLPEGLVHSIGILEAPGVFLARRWRRC